MALQVNTKSKRFSLNAPDWLKGLLIATITAPLTVIYTSIQAGSFTLNWKAIGLMAAGGFLSYVIKNFLTPAQTIVSGVPAPGTTTTVVIPPAEDPTAKPTIQETKK